jgi:hypothetical protein
VVVGGNDPGVGDGVAGQPGEVRHARGHTDLTRGQRQGGDVASGLRDPAQRPQLTSYDDGDATRGCEPIATVVGTLVTTLTTVTSTTIAAATRTLNERIANPHLDFMSPESAPSPRRASGFAGTFL